MAKPSFDINALGEDLGKIQSAHLLLELNEACFTALWYHKAAPEFYRLAQFPLSNTKESPVSEQLREILLEESWFREPAAAIHLVYNTGNAQLVPASLSTPDIHQALLDYLLGESAGSLVFSETNLSRNIQTVYRVPRDVQELFQSFFPAGSRWHNYTLLQRSIRDASESGLVYHLNFCNDKFTLAVMDNGMLRLLQDVPFEQPEDISWYLLGLTEESGYDRDSVRLVAGGLIDTSSVLYQELEKYFLKLELQELPAAFSGETALNTYPAHYFSPILNLAICV